MLIRDAVATGKGERVYFKYTVQGFPLSIIIYWMLLKKMSVVLMDNLVTVAVCYLLDAEFSYGVINQDGHIFHRYTDISIRPATLVGPILSTFTLQGARNKLVRKEFIQSQFY